MSDWIVPDWPAPRAVRAAVTTRAGGVSQGAHATFNLSDRVGDDPQAVAENRRRLRSRLPAAPCWLRQVHGTRVVEACVNAAGEKGAREETVAETAAETATEEAADAQFTRRRQTVCAVLSADCLPVFFCAEDGSAVAVAHAGWRGLAAGVLEATLAALAVPAGRILSWLGPAIGPAAFEVGEEVRAAFLAHDAAAAAAFVAERPGQWRADLFQLARQRLRAAGVSRIHGGGLCTFSDHRRFFSFRRDAQTGRMASLIWID